MKQETRYRIIIDRFIATDKLITCWLTRVIDKIKNGNYHLIKN